MKNGFQRGVQRPFRQKLTISSLPAYHVCYYKQVGKVVCLGSVPIVYRRIFQDAFLFDIQRKELDFNNGENICIYI